MHAYRLYYGRANCVSAIVSTDTILVIDAPQHISIIVMNDGQLRIVAQLVRS